MPRLNRGAFTDAEMVALYHSCDAFVLPTRERVGVPIIEAMACGLPVIVTDYGGHTEYANQNNAFLLNVEKMVEVNDPLVFSPQGAYGVWAQPDVNHLVQLLRHVFRHRDEARAKGLRAHQDVVNHWTWDHAALKAHAALYAFD